MARAKRGTTSNHGGFHDGDLKLSVAGFKAVRDEMTVRIAALTVISGANSSGKSSFMQPFLLMKLQESSQVRTTTRFNGLRRIRGTSSDIGVNQHVIELILDIKAGKIRPQRASKT